MRGEGLFGGLMALLVAGLVVYAVTDWKRGERGYDRGQTAPVDRPYLAYLTGDDDLPEPGLTDASTVCQCFDEAKLIASEGTDAEPARYRTGLIQCRSLGQEEAADAWTAGWNAALASEPWEKTCLDFKASRNLL